MVSLLNSCAEARVDEVLNFSFLSDELRTSSADARHAVKRIGCECQAGQVNELLFAVGGHGGQRQLARGSTPFWRHWPNRAILVCSSAATFLMLNTTPGL